jgi:hypothetical protein
MDGPSAMTSTSLTFAMLRTAELERYVRYVHCESLTYEQLHSTVETPLLVDALTSFRSLYLWDRYLLESL